MKVLVQVVEYEMAEPHWWQQKIKSGWRISVAVVDGVWWFVMGAQMVRHVGPDLQPEVIERAERCQHARGLGPWI